MNLPNSSHSSTADAIELPVSVSLFPIPIGFKQRRNITRSGKGDSISQQGHDQVDSPCVTIESFPVDILLDIFYFYQRGSYGYSPHRWHILVHVCRRWRDIVFAFPHHLDLYLEYTAKMRVRRTLDVWPCLPIVIRDTQTRKWPVLFGNNIIAALKRHDRVCEIELYHLPRTLLERFSRAMQVPFPALTLLKLDLEDKSMPAPVLPDTFLGGSAPRLQRLTLSGIPFPTLLKFLQSCHGLVEMRLTRIPPYGYISPKSMVTGLSVLTRLEILHIGFESPASRPDQYALPSTRVVLPSLTQLEFHGASEYFEDLVARVDAPSIKFVKVEFFNQLIFDNPQFVQFVGRTKMLRSFKRANLLLDKSMAKISLRNDSPSKPKARLQIYILCEAVDWQVSGLAQICAELSTLLSNVEQCNLEWTRNWTVPREDMDNTQWLELFRPFTSVESLEISSGLEELIAPVLQELTGDRVLDVLPVLRTLSEPKSPNTFEPLIRARQLSYYPVTLTDLTHPLRNPTSLYGQKPLRVGHTRSNAVDLRFSKIFKLGIFVGSK